MWHKTKKVPLIELISMAVKSKSPADTYVTWLTNNCLLHMCSLATIEYMNDEDYNDNTVFTIWEKG